MDTDQFAGWGILETAGVRRRNVLSNYYLSKKRLEKMTASDGPLGPSIRGNGRVWTFRELTEAIFISPLRGKTSAAHLKTIVEEYRERFAQLPLQELRRVAIRVMIHKEPPEHFWCGGGAIEDGTVDTQDLSYRKSPSIQVDVGWAILMVKEGYPALWEEKQAETVAELA